MRSLARRGGSTIQAEAGPASLEGSPPPSPHPHFSLKGGWGRPVGERRGWPGSRLGHSLHLKKLQYGSHGLLGRFVPGTLRLFWHRAGHAGAFAPFKNIHGPTGSCRPAVVRGHR